MISKNLDKINLSSGIGEMAHYFLVKGGKELNYFNQNYKKAIDGNMLILAQGASGGNYSHWLLDILPKLKLASLQYNLNKIDYFYFSKLNSFQLQILKLIGINKNKFIDAEKNKHCFSKKIIFISHPNYFKGTISEAHSNMPKWIIRYLRKKFLKLTLG